MKKLLFSCLVSMVFVPAFGQSASRPLVYGSLGTSILTNYRNSSALSLDLIYPSNNTYSFGFRRQLLSKVDVPDNFQKARGKYYVFPGNVVYASVDMFCAAFGKVFPGKSANYRTILKGGLLLGEKRTPYFSKINYPNGRPKGWPSHEVFYERESAYGVMLSGGVEFPVARKLGFSLAAVANLNTVAFSWGIEGAVLFGRVR